jgi:hypothetical protein
MTSSGPMRGTGADESGSPQRPLARHAGMSAAVRPELPAAKMGRCWARAQSSSPTAAWVAQSMVSKTTVEWPEAMRVSSVAEAEPHCSARRSSRPTFLQP